MHIPRRQRIAGTISPPEPCKVEFEVSAKNANKALYCNVCAPYAKKWLSAKNANRRYKSDPVKFAKIALTSRHKRREATGDPVRPIGSIQLCEYLTKDAKPAEGCEISYQVRSSAQKYCNNCQKLKDAERAQEFRETHPEEEKKRQAERWQKVRQQLKDIKDGKLVPLTAADVELLEDFRSGKLMKVDPNAVVVPKTDAALISKFLKGLKLGPERAAEIREAKQRTKLGGAVKEKMPLAATLLAAKAGLPPKVRRNRTRFNDAMRALGFSEQEIERTFLARQSDQLALARYLVADAEGETFDNVKRHHLDYVRDQKSLPSTAFSSAISTELR